MIDCVRLKPTTHSPHGNQQMSRMGGESPRPPPAPPPTPKAR